MTVAFTILLTCKGDLNFGETQKGKETNPGVEGEKKNGVIKYLKKKKKKRKKLQEPYKVGRRIDADSLTCSFGHCECDGHTVQKLS